MDRSIKAQVIALAKSDPFLTVDELAHKAQTTPSYVRTILSEAQLSLNEMRREYAKRLERNIEAKQMEALEVQKELRIIKIAATTVTPEVESWLGHELFQASAPQKIGSQLGYARLITPEALNFVDDYSTIRDLLPRSIAQHLEVKEQRAEIIPASQGLASFLQLPKLSWILQLTTSLYHQNAPIAIETTWAGADGLVLEWSQTEPELKLSMGS